jgi:hypothetical protein
MESSISLKEAFKKSFSLFKNNCVLFLSIAFIGQIIGLFDYFFLTLPTLPYVLIAVLGCFLRYWASIALIIAISKRYSNDTITLKECFLGAKGKYWRFVGVSVFLFLIIATGYLLVFLPGMYFYVIFFFATTVVVLEDKNIAPFKMSKILTEGNFWKILLVSILFYFSSSIVMDFSLRFSGINQNWPSVLCQLFMIICLPFLKSLEVTLYYQLRTFKKEFLSQELLPRIKKGHLGQAIASAIGLIILMMLLSVCWYYGRNTFYKTQYSEFFKQVKSPAIILPGGVELKRPKEWLVRKEQSWRKVYSLEIFKNKKIESLLVWSFEISDDISVKQVSLNDAWIREEILENNIGNSSIMRMVFQDYKPQPLNIVNIGNRQWGEDILKREASCDSFNIWKNFYTIHNKHAIIISYSYEYQNNENKEYERDIIVEEDEIRKIISTIYFPESVDTSFNN